MFIFLFAKINIISDFSKYLLEIIIILASRVWGLFNHPSLWLRFRSEGKVLAQR